mgnify:CR=1 FL=1|tara:strand:- start:421 stop:1038 length:618 start_codon:yes stop_codon:yes gene_type:complete
MKIEDTWNSIETEKIALGEGEVLESIHKKRTNVMTKLQKKLIAKLIFAITFTIAYTLVLFFVKDLLVISLFAFLIFVHLLAIAYFLKEYRDMQKLIPMDGNVLETLKEFQKRILRVIKSEETGGLILYPVAISAGFFFSILSNRTMEELMMDRWIWVFWIGLMIAFTPIGNRMAKKLNKKAFGEQLNRLQEMIDDLESVNENSKP